MRITVVSVEYEIITEKKLIVASVSFVLASNSPICTENGEYNGNDQSQNLNVVYFVF